MIRRGPASPGYGAEKVKARPEAAASGLAAVRKGSNVFQEPGHDIQAFLLAEEDLRGEQGRHGAGGRGQMGQLSVCPGGCAVLRQKGALKIFGTGKAAGEADIQKGAIRPQQLAPSLLTPQLGEIFLEGHAEVVMEEVGEIVEIHAQLPGQIPQQQLLAAAPLDALR